MDKQRGPTEQHRELYPVSWDRTMDNSMRKSVCVCVCVCVRHWVNMLYSRNWHNTVNQLYSNRKKKKKKHQ